jgi:hypothetical protein
MINLMDYMGIVFSTAFVVALGIFSYGYHRKTKTVFGFRLYIWWILALIFLVLSQFDSSI